MPMFDIIWKNGDTWNHYGPITNYRNLVESINRHPLHTTNEFLIYVG